MTVVNKQALRKLAKALSGKEWVAFVHKASGTYAVGSLGHERGEDIIKWPGLDGQDNAESKAKFIAAASPATVLALLDELEYYKSREERVTKLVLDNSASWDELYKKLEAAEKRIAELDGLALENIRLKVGISGLIGLGLRYADADVMRLAADAQQSTPTTDGIIENIVAGIGVKGE
ncbi:TPA: ead/Ea22-like family protein [Citrobacter freundii]|nr:ead/Ea22-like family protein [Citrobacter freundii]